MRIGRRRGGGINSIERGHPRNHRGYVLFYWHRPAYGLTLVGSAVSGHADQSGAGIDMAQATAGFRPLFDETGINGRPGIKYDGIDDVMDSASFTAVSQPTTRFLISKHLAGGGSSQIVVDGNTSQRQTVFKSSATAAGIYAGGVLTAPYTLDTNPHLWTAVFNGASSKVRIDAVDLVSGNPGSNAVALLRYGSQQGGGGGWLLGYMGESIGYKTAMPADVIARLERRLKALYGVP